ncbi:MAG: nicotinate-nucleotide--dimethylbenzimidazole phosphoribosyltransferase, partial [Lentisphaerae bacterium]|nr:nicotinate-nucleotide--dimethylbenzimidazole phosphoribosyltransferase [Lentisphaerota bacterium]
MSRLKEAIGSIPLPDEGVRERALDRLRNQARPTGSLGVLEDVGAKLAAVSGTLDVCLQRKVVVTCAGDHGIVAEGVSLFPQDVTWQMVANFVNGGASINVLAKHAGARVIVADLGVNHDFDPALPICHKKVRRGTANFRREPAMTREQAVTSVEAGIEIVDELVADGGLDLLGTG